MTPPPIDGLAFNGKFLTAKPTGVHRVAYELIAAMDRLDFESDGCRIGARILAPHSNIHRPEYENLPIKQIGINRAQIWEQVDLPWRGRRELIVNLCNLGPVLANSAITMIHDAQVFITPSSYRRLFRSWYKVMLPLIGYNHHKIVTVSEFSRQQLAKYGVAPLDKIEVIYNGADHILRSPSTLDAFERLPLARHKYVVALANTQDHKNIGLLLRTFATESLKDKKLVLVGAEGFEEFSLKFGRIPENVIFAGRISDGELRGLMENALCLAFPSKTEGFGLPPLEAMLLGCAVVAAPCGALSEVCGVGALFAEPNDEREWALAIASLENVDLRHALVERGHRQASTFTWDRAARQLLGIIHRSFELR